MSVILSLLFTASLSFANGEPKNFCYQGCSPQQEAIWAAFEAAKFIAPDHAVYSGDCYHLSPSYKNTDVHHGVFYFSEIGGQMHGSGKFSFFAKSNPYESFDIARAEKEFPLHKDASRVLQPLELSQFLDHSSEETIMRYWFRHAADQSRTYVVGQWGKNHILFCELGRNP